MNARLLMIEIIQVLLREEAKNLKEANRELSTKLQDTKFLWDSARQDAFRMKGELDYYCFGSWN